jgi:hypothetical protein
MGVIKRGILGGFSGKVANVVGSSWKGIAVIKSLPLSVSNPKTAGQVAQRGKFSQAVALSKQILTEIIKPLWDRFAQGKSGYNAFLQTNIDAFNADGLATPADLVISEGVIESTAIGTGTYDFVSGEVTLPIVGVPGEGNRLATDEAYVVVVDTSTEKAYGFSAVEAMGTGANDIVVTVDTGLAATNLFAYLAFRRADGTQVSNTAVKQLDDL